MKVLLRLSTLLGVALFLSNSFLFAQTPDSVLVARINFGGNLTAPNVSGWSDLNPWQNFVTGGKYNDVTYTLSGNDSISIEMYNNTNDHWGFQSSTNAHSGDAGYGTGSNTGVVPDLVLDHYWFVQNDSASLAITGSAINNSKEYSLNMGGSRVTSGSRLSRYHIDGTTKVTEAVNNTSAKATFTGVSPQAGKIIVSVANDNYQFGYLNWIEVWELGPAELMAPGNVTITGLAVDQVDLSWEDNSSDEGNFEIARSADHGQTYVSIAVVPADTTSFQDVNLATGTYQYRVRAVDSSTNRQSDFAFTEQNATVLGEGGYPASANTVGILTPVGAGTAVGSSYFPMEYAFAGQPAWDGVNEEPVGGLGVLQAPQYPGRFGYVDFGPNYADVRITGTWTQYRPWSGPNHTPYVDAWWDDDNDFTNDGVDETQINFNSAQGLSSIGELQWVQDLDASASPITPQGRYLIMRAPPSMSNRAAEYAFVGYLTTEPVVDTTSFITTWKTDNAGTSTNTQITIPTAGSGYNYSVFWEEVGNASSNGSAGPFTGNATIDFPNAGTYQVSISGDYPRVFFNNGGDKDKILSVEQWGNQVWSAMSNAFQGCTNLVINASDAPDLSNVTSLKLMFYNASNMNGNLNHWDVSTILNMDRTFANTAFNGDLNSWDVSNVNNMYSLFSSASSFNGDISNWDVSQVENMNNLFSGAAQFNQNIGSWNVSNVAYMRQMFKNATAFNQDIGGWNVSNAKDMYRTFYNADSFNQDIGTWQVDSVTDMTQMFYGAEMFNQNLDGWNVSEVTTMDAMFIFASAYDQSMASWDLGKVTNVVNMLRRTGLSPANYDATLAGWATLDPGETQIPQNLAFDALDVEYCDDTGRNTLINTHGWTITGDTQNCPVYPFVTTWKTDNPGSSNSTQVTIPTSGTGYNYNVSWEEVGNSSNNGTAGPFTGNATIDFPSAGTYQVSISGDFPRIFFNNEGDKDKILSIEQWGDQVWTYLANAFQGCTNLIGMATDAPDLSQVTVLSRMFEGASSFNQDLDAWDVSNVTNMFAMFYQANSFNGNLGTWNVSSVTTTQYMFAEATSFNQDIGNWQVGNVTTMANMFSDATSFNQDIGSWDLSSVATTANMFAGATSFNQDLSGWDVSSITNLSNLFRNATSFNGDVSGWNVSSAQNLFGMFYLAGAFDHDLGSWNISSATNLDYFLQNSGLSSLNYTRTLDGWVSQGALPNNLSLRAGGLSFCDDASRTILLGTYGWTILGDVPATVGCESYIDLPDANGDSVLVARINFGGYGTAPTVANWSNPDPWQNFVTGGPYTNATYGLVGNDSISIEMYNNTDDHWGFQAGTIVHTGDFGHTSGDNSGYAPDNVLKHYWFVQNDSASIAITGAGIDDSKTYSLNMGGSRSGTGSRLSRYHVNGTTKTSEAINNVSNRATFSGVTPQAGKITVSVSNDNNEYGYLGWIEVWEVPTPAPTQHASVYVNFGQTNAAPAPWNNSLSIPDNLNMVDLLDENGVNTGIDLVETSNWTGTYDPVFAGGATTGNDSGVYPDQVLEEYYYFGYFNVPAVITMELRDLDPTKHYDLTFFASSNWNGVADNGTTVYTVNGVSAELDVQGNTSATAAIPYQQPDANGVLEITLSEAPGTPLGYINAMVVTPSAGPPNLETPTNLIATYQAAYRTAISWTDNNVNETGYEIARKLAADPGYTTIDTVAADQMYYIDTQVTSENTYHYQVRAINEISSAQSAYSSELIITTPQPQTNPATYINLSQVNEGPLPWNNSLSLPNDLNMIDLVDENGTNTGIDLVNTSNWTGSQAGVFAGGATTGNDSGVYPDLVMEEYYYFGIFSIPDTIKLELRDLDPAEQYDLTFFASSTWTGVPDNGTTGYRVNGQSVELYVQDNTSNTVTLNHLSPTSGGVLQITMYVAAGSPLGYLNALVVAPSAGLQDLLAPGNVAITDLTGDRVDLSWEDNTSDEGNFEIERSSDFGQTYTSIGLAPADSTNFSDTILVAGTYQYRVRAIDTTTSRESEYAFTEQNATILGLGGYPSELDSIGILTPYGAGTAGGSSYFPMDHAFAGQPAWDKVTEEPVGGLGVKQAPYYPGRFGYIDFGPDYSEVRITGTWTQYRPYSGGDHTPYVEAWWDDDNDFTNDGVDETQINFNSALGLSSIGELQWVQGLDASAAPITPQGRYLIMRAPPSMSNRAAEYAFTGYVTAASEIDTTSFITTWKTDNPGTSADTQITIPTTGSGYNYNVTWQEVGNAANSGTAGPFTGNTTIDFPSVGTYQVSISGDFPRIFFDNGGDKEKILSIDQWGDQVWTSMDRAFFGCSNLSGNPTDDPDLSTVTMMGNMFRGASQMDADISGWDVSNVVTMENMFYGATAFDQNIESWDVSSVTTMSRMFRGATSFNQPLDGWDVSTVTDIAQMFRDATSFNQPLGNWNVGNVTTMIYLFYETPFDQPVGNWNVSNVTNMEFMFSNAAAFDQDLSSWDVSQVTNMEAMFFQASAFNQNIEAWQVGSVTNMGRMFRGASAFNQPLDGWDVGMVTSMAQMFRESAFNQPLASWNVGNVTTMINMFYQTPFNQPIGNWDVSNVTNLEYMFRNASTFDQDLSSWDISNALDLNEMLSQTNLSSYHYNQLLLGWSSLPTLPSNINLGVIGLSYCDQAARDVLTGTHGWVISGDTQVTDCSNPDAPDPSSFITTWKTNNPGTSTDTQITIPTTGSGYNYNVTWQEVGNAANSGTAGPFTGNATIDFPSAGTYQVSITGDFPRISFYNAGDTEKILSVDQWGDNAWTSMNLAFNNCASLHILASDAPDLSNVTNLSKMFQGASAMNENINHWDVSTITAMQDLFLGATAYNQPLDNWNVGNVTNMSRMFNDAVAFNQPLASWDVSNVTNMNQMFFQATAFNQNIESWDVSSVTTMSRMFRGATSFNQPLDGWNVSTVTDIAQMFRDATSFNQPLGNWNVGNVTTMIYLFYETPFDQPVGNWDVSNVTNMEFMFSNAAAFDQDLSSWDVSQVTNMEAMFFQASAFNQNIEAWQVGSVTNMGRMFRGASAFNQPLEGWDVSMVTSMAQMFRESAFNQPLASWNVGNVTTMINMFYQTPFNQPIGDWDVSNATNLEYMFRSASAFDQDLSSWDISNALDLNEMLSQTNLSSYHYNQLLLGWSSLPTLPSNINLGVIGLSYCDQAARDVLTGTHGWVISGDTQVTDCSNPDAPDPSSFITTWKTDNPGTSANTQITIPTTGTGYNFSVSWEEVGNAANSGTAGPFTGNAIIDFPSAGTYQVSISGDFPRIYFNNGGDKEKILSVDQWGDQVWASMEDAFEGCFSLRITAIDAPDLSNVSSMRYMFSQATSMDDDISFWDVSNVTDMRFLFEQAVDFDQNLGAWDVSNVTDMGFMFSEAINYHGVGIGSWDVGNVTQMDYMFLEIDFFNEDIGSWDVDSLESIGGMFYGASAFDQDLGTWDISGLQTTDFAFDSSGMSSENFEATLQGWSTLSPGETQIPQNLVLDAYGWNHCASTVYKTLTNTFNWTITGTTGGCPFITTWKTDNAGTSTDTQITIPTVGSGYNYNVAWQEVGNASNSGTAGPFIGNATIDFPSAGTYQVSISGDFPRIYFNNGGDKDKILSVDQWGDQVWTSMERAFFGGTNVVISSTDAPDLSMVTDFRNMFNSATSVDQGLENWDVSNVTNMASMFYGLPLFNADISGWDVSQVTDMGDMFHGASTFNQDLSGWNVSNVTAMEHMFDAATSFNQDLSGWQVGNVTTMKSMFINAPSVNFDVSSWDVGNVTDMSGMFANASAFNLDVSSWQVGNVTNMASMFYGLPSFNADISGWDVSQVTDMGDMLHGATAFNQDLSDWNVSNVTDMENFFRTATSFNQDLGNWDVSNVTNMQSMFSSSGLSPYQYNQTLIGWSSLPSLQSNVALGATGLLYCDQAAHDVLTVAHGWVITGDAYTTDCSLSCGIPTISSITRDSTSLEVFFDDSFADASGYTIFYRQGFESAYLEDSVSTSPYLITGLNPGTDHQVRVQSICMDGTTSDLSPVSNVITENSSACGIPTVSVSAISSSELEVSWDANEYGEYNGLIVGYRQGFSGAFIEQQVFTSPFVISGLVSEADYQVRAQTICSGYESAVSSTINVVMPPPAPFVTTWKTDNPGTSTNTQITIPTTGTGYNYNVTWEEVGNAANNGTAGPFTGDATIDFPSAGTFQVSVSGDFPRIYFNNGGDKDKILSVDQWGGQVWTSMGKAFDGCSNLSGNANDIPDLSSVTSMSLMFRGATSFNGDIGDWEVSNVIAMDYMFDGAGMFNQSLRYWDVRNVVDMKYMFRNAVSFNGDITTWQVSQVNYVVSMFQNAALFNQDISGWELTGATQYDNLFFDASSFNHDISIWDVGHVTSMSYMFAGADSFNQPIGDWDVSNVTNMSNMFNFAEAFNQDLSAWDVSQVTSLRYMFMAAQEFNQDISSWDVSNVTNMDRAFYTARKFNQNLGAWDISSVTNMEYMLFSSGLSQTNYDATLQGWSVLDAGETQIPQNLTLESFGLSYCDETARNSLVNDHGWTISDDTKDCHFITTWKTDNPGASNDNQISIPTYGSGYNYSIQWEEVGNSTNSGTAGPFTTSTTLDFPGAGTYQVSISGDFPRIFFQDFLDREKIIEVNQWGDQVWASMANAFSGCANLDVTAMDAPDLSVATNLHSMFSDAIDMNGDIGHWDLSNVTNIGGMFKGASSFNRDISSWDVSNVTNMFSTFQGATAFNKPLGDWDVSNVANMSNLFRETRDFNQDIGNWDVGSVTDMSYMFSVAQSFNQDIGYWDVSSVANMGGVLYAAGAFNQSLASWDIGAVTSLATALNGTSLSQSNYDATLRGWSTLDVGETQIPQNLTFDVHGLEFCEDEGRDVLINTHNWSIVGDTKVCPFIATWQTTQANETIVIPTTGSGYNYSVDWGDGTVDSDIIGSASHQYASPGTHQISISGQFPQIYFNNGGDKDKIITIDLWGTNSWISMNNAFAGCSNLDIEATDSPDLSGVSDVSRMFFLAGTMNADISGWDVSQVSIMSGMLNGASAFDQDLGSWDLTNVMDMSNMLDHSGLSTTNYEATLTGWAAQGSLPTGITLGAAGLGHCGNEANWSSLTTTNNWTIEGGGMACEFVTTWRTNSANESITIPTTGTGYNYTVDWGDGTVESGFTGDATHSYSTAGTHQVSISGDFPRIAFNWLGDFHKIRTVEQWGSIEWLSMHRAFEGCYNLTINAADAPDLSRVTDISFMFNGAGNVSSDLQNWDVSNVEDMSGMFANNFDFNGDISGWNVSSVKTMARMFLSAGQFNQDLSGWNVGRVEDMSEMFAGAYQFNQNINGWDVSSVRNMRGMFASSQFNSNIGSWDVSNVTNMSQMFANNSEFNQSIDQWDVSSVTTLEGMFLNSSAFNQSLNSWDVSKVTSMHSMFSSSSFNGDVSSWEVSSVTDMHAMFQSSAFNQDIGQWNVGNVTDMSLMFMGASNFDQDLSFWNTAQVENMQSMFQDASSFDQNLGAWNIASVTNMQSMLDNAGLSVDNFDETLISWSNSTNLPTNITLGAIGVSICNGYSSYEKLINDYQWQIATGPIECAFTTIWKTDNPGSSSNTQILLPINHGSFDVEWEEVNNPSNSGILVLQAGNPIDFPSPGTYKVSFIPQGSLQMAFNNAGDKEKILSVEQWGFNVTWSSMVGMFWGCTNLEINATDAPNLTNVTSMTSMFQGATSMNQDISFWDVSNVQSMDRMFMGATSFNQDIGGWDVGSASGMFEMFKNASSFNQDLGSWNVGSVSDFQGMFENASSFNQNLGEWSPQGLMDNMLNNAGLSLDNYDATLVGWSTIDAGEDPPGTNINLGASGLRYCEATSARSVLENTYNWNITGDQGDCKFITTWETTSANESITIPTTGSGYNYNVDWGDGSQGSGFNGNASHNYASPGTYTVSITGDFPRIYFNNTGDKDKIRSVEQWGSIIWNSMRGAFWGCFNFNINATDAPDLRQSYNMRDMFRDATMLNADLSMWDMMFVENMDNMFKDASSFDQDLGDWNLENVISMTGMFDYSGMSLENYDATLIGWGTLEPGEYIIRNGVDLGATGLRYCNSSAVRSSLMTSYGWSIVGDHSDCPFQITFRTMSGNETVTIPTAPSVLYDYTVDWGDGIKESGFAGDALHSYAAPGDYVVTISGTFPQIYFNNGGDKQKLVSVDRWGDTDWSSMENAFWGCSNLIINASDVPDLTGVLNMSNMFRAATSVNQDFNEWDVSAVTNMSGLFFGATTFNQAIDLWSVSNVTDMSDMFKGATSFNTYLGSWPTLNVTDMSGMFEGATSFNQDLENWNVSNVQDMSGMFKEATSFNGDIGSWVVHSVQNMSRMFYQATSFNQGLGSWYVGNVLDFSEMFKSATSFNQYINIHSLEPNGQVSLQGMFENATAFNQPLSWDVREVVDMSNLFKSATSFNQDLGGWDISDVTDMTGMLDNTGITTENYDKLLQGWSAQSVAGGVVFGVAGLSYCFGTEGRNTLDQSWTFVGDASSCEEFEFVSAGDGNWSEAIWDNSLSANVTENRLVYIEGNTVTLDQDYAGITVVISSRAGAPGKLIVDGFTLTLSDAIRVLTDNPENEVEIINGGKILVRENE